METIGLILAGGSGTRLWPLSRQAMPKQLLSLTGDNTLLQDTCQRIAPIISYNRQWLITGEEYYFQVKNQVNELSGAGENIEILKEPCAKNTAPAIFWAVQRCLRKYGEDSILVILPSDQVILRSENYIEDMNAAIKKAEEGYLVVFGINPDRPETGYGYIRINEKNLYPGCIYPVDSFVEKPDMQTAVKYLTESNYFWNSGMFVFHVGAFMKQAFKYCPDLYDIFSKHDPFNSEDVIKAFKHAKSISIDYALMEKADNVFAVYSSFGWSDIGSWKSMYEISEKDQNGNVISGEHIVINTDNSLIYSKDRLIAAVGLKDIAVIDTADALLVCPLERSQDIKEIVDQLKKKKDKKYIEHKTVQRPWGTYSIIEEGPLYKIKKIVVKPQQKLSLQYHYHRSEHWIVVRGTAKVTNGENTYFVHENESTFIPKSVLHQLENPGLIALEIIETQCGTYLEEDDIVRIEDNYDR